MAIAYCQDPGCGRKMSWYPKKEPESEGHVWDRGTQEYCDRCRKTQRRALQPVGSRKLGREALCDFEDLVFFIEQGFGAKEIADKFGYKHYQNIYIRLRRAGRVDLKETLKLRAQPGYAASGKSVASLRTRGYDAVPHGRRMQ
jgi:hypothetical protein